MTTPAHTDFDSNAPLDSQTPAAYAGDDLDNLRALRDMVIAGLVPGFVQSRTAGTGTVTQPQYVTWYNSSLGIGFRWAITWTSFNPTTVQEEWTNDSGASWTAVGSAQVNTFDASDNVTASTNSGGFVTVVFELWGKVVRAVSGLAAHIAGTGTGVHGLGSISTQSAAAAALTGTSTLDGTGGVGQSTPPPVDATRVREAFHDYGTIAAGGTVTLELDKYAAFSFTPDPTTSSAVTIAFSGVPTAGKFESWQLEIINGQRSADAKITWPTGTYNAKWIGGSTYRPVDTSLEVSGRNLFAFSTRDACARAEFLHLGKGG